MHRFCTQPFVRLIAGQLAYIVAHRSEGRHTTEPVSVACPVYRAHGCKLWKEQRSRQGSLDRCYYPGFLDGSKLPCSSTAYWA